MGKKTTCAQVSSFIMSNLQRNSFLLGHSRNKIGQVTHFIITLRQLSENCLKHRQIPSFSQFTCSSAIESAKDRPIHFNKTLAFLSKGNIYPRQESHKKESKVSTFTLTGIEVLKGDSGLINVPIFSLRVSQDIFLSSPKKIYISLRPCTFFLKYCLKTGFRRGFRILFRGMFPQQQIFCSKRILLHFLFEVALYYLRVREVFCHCYFLRSRDFSPSCCDTANNFLLCFSLPGISRNPAHELSVEKKNMYYTHTSSHVSKRLKYENWGFSRTTTVGIKNCRNCIEQPINVPLSQCSHSLNPCNARRCIQL